MKAAVHVDTYMCIKVAIPPVCRAVFKAVLKNSQTIVEQEKYFLLSETLKEI